MSDTPSPQPPTWSDLALSAEALQLIQNAGYTQPTEIQVKSIPHVLEGKDLIALSRTGSGKTATFVLPLVERLAGRKGTFGLILAPTREIAQQIQATLEIFAHPRGVSSGILIGGVDYRYDEDALQKYPSVLVATPGRLVDHIEKGNVWLEFIEFLVLDEADRMLEMGFSTQLNKIVAETPKSRQTLLFSATMPAEVERFAQGILVDPVRVTIGTLSKPTESVEHRFVEVAPADKISALKMLMEKESGTIMVFVERKLDVTRIYHKLHSEGYYDVVGMHSDLPQSQREKVLADFKEKTYRVLIATDIVGRGIHVDNVAHVVNFDFPREPEDYVHRIGRTGRQDQKGVATSLVTRRDQECYRKVKQTIGEGHYQVEIFSGSQRRERSEAAPQKSKAILPKAKPKPKLSPAVIESVEPPKPRAYLSEIKRKRTVFPV